MTVRILVGDALTVLRTLPAESVQCVVTSPPYWGLRDYGIPALVWGGDPSCAHVFGASGKRHKGGPHGDGVLLGGGRAVVDAQAATKDINTGAFCAKCGAWRGSLGLEPTPELYVDHLVSVFDEVRRVLKKNGTLWLNLGDCYATGAGKVGDHPGGGEQGARWRGEGSKHDLRKSARPARNGRREHQSQPIDGRKGSNRAQRGDGNAGAPYGPMSQPNRMPIPGIKAKELVGIPWMAAFALRRAGWWLRAENIWHKPSPMPESVKDRTTRAHEQMFMLTKAARYFYNAEAIAEPATSSYDPDNVKAPDGWDTEKRAHGSIHVEGRSKGKSGNKARKLRAEHGGVEGSKGHQGATRNKRSVWTIASQPFPEAHFATFPPALVEPCILAGTTLGGVVLDPFGGAGTTGLVADRLGRDALLIELNPKYALMAERRIRDDNPLFAEVAREA